MGLFGKIKNILFEDDEEEVEEMPVYTKEDVKENTKKIEEEIPKVVEEPIKTSDNSRFTNLKRDNDLSFDENDVLGEVAGGEHVVKENIQQVEETPVEPKEEKKSIFPSFDEDEFERLNSRIMRNENRARQERRDRPEARNNANVGQNNSVNEARRANNNFSATTTVRDNRIDDMDRYKINPNPPVKSFKPSPIISPVYGILDKNYTKDDIVDKKDGMKREKVVKPVVKKEEVKLEVIKEEVVPVKKAIDKIEVDIDSVRKKAYGELQELENTLTKMEFPELKDVKVDDVEEIVDVTQDISKEQIQVGVIEEISDITEKLHEEVVNEPSIEEQLETNFNVADIEVDSKEDKELDEVVEKVMDKKNQDKTTKKPQMLDDLEKTSTLQILDDIEKELNSIKPISKGMDEEIEEEKVVKDDTLEKDLFNLIDSMYEEGEEDIDG